VEASELVEDDRVLVDANMVRIRLVVLRTVEDVVIESVNEGEELLPVVLVWLVDNFVKVKDGMLSVVDVLVELLISSVDKGKGVLDAVNADGLELCKVLEGKNEVPLTDIESEVEW
jgi:hypothetical protein